MHCEEMDGRSSGCDSERGESRLGGLHYVGGGETWLHSLPLSSGGRWRDMVTLTSYLACRVNGKDLVVILCGECRRRRRIKRISVFSV